MGDSPVTNTIENIAGRGIGALAALTSLKGGGLQNYFLNRQRVIADPGFRATLVGSPFTAGVFGQSQQTAGPGDAMPGAATVAQPADFVGPPAPASHAIASPSDIAFLHQQMPDRRSLPNLPPLGAEKQVEVQAAQGIVSGLQSSDPAVRAQAKLAGKIPLTPDEMTEVVRSGVGLQKSLGPGGTVGLQVPGMPIQIGSPYNFASISAEEYPTFELATAAANARNAGLPPGSPQWHVMPSGRGSFLIVPPPTHEQGLPQTPPAPARTGEMPGAPPAPVMRGGTPPTPTVPQPGTPPQQGRLSAYDPRFDAAADKYGHPRGLLNSVAHTESNFDPNATGPPIKSLGGVRAQGLMQFIPDTANQYGIDPNDPNQAIDGAARYLADLRDKHGGDYVAALQEYGGGPKYPTGTILTRADAYRRAQGTAGSQTAAADVTPPGAAAPSPAFDETAPPPPKQDAWADNLAQRVRAGYITPEQAAAANGGVPVVATPPTPAAPRGPVVAPPPPPPPQVPRRPAAAAPAAPAFDPDATVPHVLVPAPAPADATVGYPSAAPAPPPGTIVPQRIQTLPTPPVPTAPAGPPGAAVLPGTNVDPNTGLPLQSRTYESQTGSETFTAPPRGDDRTQMLMRKYGITDWAQASAKQVNDYMAEERALKQQDKFDEAAIARTQQPMTAEERKISNRYAVMKAAYDDFITKYPDPEQRAKFLGWAQAPWDTVLTKLGWRNAQEIRDFRNDMAAFGVESMTDEKGKAQPGFEVIAQMAPSPFDSPGAFESNLQHFGNALNREITIDTNTRTLPAGAATPAVVQGWIDGMRAQQDTAPPPEAPAIPVAPPAAAYAAPPPAPQAATAPPVWQPNWIH